jgi:hypothetical protein
MSHRALGPMFHGTAHEVEPGSSIVPGKQYGKSSFRHGGVGPRGKAHSESAFATTSEDEAWHFAERSAYYHGGRGRVHEVEPHPDMQPGLYNPEHPTFARRNRHEAIKTWREYAAPSFRPTGKTIDIKPGRQGTFPNLNWNQFSADKMNVFDKNHPDPYEVLHGSHGSKAAGESAWEQHNRENGYPVGNRELDGPKPEPQAPGQRRMF